MNHRLMGCEEETRHPPPFLKMFLWNGWREHLSFRAQAAKNKGWALFWRGKIPPTVKRMMIVFG